VYVNEAEVTVPMLGEVHETKTYWHPAPQLTGVFAVSVCVDPATKMKVFDVVTGLPSKVTYPEPVGPEMVIWTPKFAVSVIGPFIVRVAEGGGVPE